MNAPPKQEEEGSFTYSLGVRGILSVFEHQLLAGMKHVYNRVGWLFLFFNNHQVGFLKMFLGITQMININIKKNWVPGMFSD